MGLAAASLGLCLAGSRAATGAAPAATEPPRYLITALGTLGRDSDAYEVNNYGQVVGGSLLPGDGIRGFLWTPSTPNGTTGTMRSVPTLGGNSEAYAINDHGQVVGQSRLASGYDAAFLWTPAVPNGVTGSIKNLGTLGGLFSRARDINNRGQVTGTAGSEVGPYLAFRWTPSSPNGTTGAMFGLPVVEDMNSYGYGINNVGDVVGDADTGVFDRGSAATLWRGVSPTDLGDLGRFATAVAVNNQRQVVGDSVTTAGRSHAYRWEDGVMTDLLPFDVPSRAFDINEAGQVVGVGFDSGATLWHEGRPYGLSRQVDFARSGASGVGWTNLNQAYGINDKGQIVGSGYRLSNDGTPEPRAFLLTPAPAPSADVSVSAANTPSAARAGMDFTYTRNVRNSGPDPATEVNFLETLPTGVTFRSAQSTQGTLLQDGNRVAFQLGTLAKLGTATITFTIRHNTTGLIKLNAQVGGLEADPDESNNFAEQSLTVGRGVANLGLALTAKPLPVKVGGTLDYTVTVTNHGLARATGVTLTNTLPAGADFVSASSGAGKFVRSGNIITFTFPVVEVSHEDDFPPDKADAIATIVVRTKTVGTLRYTAQVRAAQSDEPSPDPHPNAASIDATVSPLEGSDLTGAWGTIDYINNKKKRISKLSGAFTIRNAGNLPSGATQLRFYLSDDQILDDGDTPVPVVMAVPVLEAGATWTKQKRRRGRLVQVPTTFSFDVPRRTGGGSPFLGKFAILVIAPSAVAELNANNNQAVSAPLP